MTIFCQNLTTVVRKHLWLKWIKSSAKNEAYEEKSHLFSPWFNPTPNFAAKFWIEKKNLWNDSTNSGSRWALQWLAPPPALSMSVLLLCAQLNWPVEFRLLSWEYLSCPDWLRGNSSESQSHSWAKKQNPAKNKFAWIVFTSFLKQISADSQNFRFSIALHI